MPEWLTEWNAAPIQGSELGPGPFGLVLMISLLSSLAIARFYVVFFEARSTGSEIHRSFLLLGPAITAIFVCLQFSLPLSLGLLGALSIVRFRTPVKEPEEIGFLMLLIAASICCATLRLKFLAVLLGVSLFGLILVALLPRIMRPKGRRGILVVEMGPEGDDTVASLTRLFTDEVPDSRLDGLTRDAGGWSATYSFGCSSPQKVSELHARVQAAAPDSKVSFYYHQSPAL